MKWNWQKEDWPEFFYNTAAITKFETEFSYNFGLIFERLL